MIAVRTLLAGRVFDMSLRDIILQKMRGKITEVILLTTTIGMGTVTAIMPEMNIAVVTHRYATSQMVIAVVNCRLGIDVISSTQTVPTGMAILNHHSKRRSCTSYRKWTRGWEMCSQGWEMWSRGWTTWQPEWNVLRLAEDHPAQGGMPRTLDVKDMVCLKKLKRQGMCLQTQNQWLKQLPQHKFRRNMVQDLRKMKVMKHPQQRKNHHTKDVT